MIIDHLVRHSPSTSDSQAVKEAGANLSSGVDSRFAAILNSGRDAPSKPARLQEAAEAAAELLRLDMMRSAFSLGDPEGGSAATQVSSRAIDLVLKSFAENSRKSDTGSSPVETPASSSVDAPVQGTLLPASAESGNWLDGVVTRASRRYGVEVGLIRAVIKAESNFNPKAVSHAGAQGLMQLMPATAGDYGVTDAFDVHQNIEAGTRHLAELLARYRGDVRLATAAYNAGAGAVERHGGIPPFTETRVYVERVGILHRRYRGES